MSKDKKADKTPLVVGGLGLGTIYLAHKALKRLKDRRAGNK